MSIKNLISAEEVVQLAYTTSEQIAKEHITLPMIMQAQHQFIRPVLNGLYEELLENLHPEFCTTFVKPALAHYVKYLTLGQQVCYDSKNDERMRQLRHETLVRASTLIDLCGIEAEAFPSYDCTQNARYNILIKGGILLTKTN